jgi:hypothetical protein
MDWIVTRNGKRYTFPADADETDIRGTLGGDYQVEQRPAPTAPMASHGGPLNPGDVDPATGQTVGDESAGTYPVAFGENVVNHLPELAAMGAAPFTGGMSLLPAAATVGSAAAAGSLARSGIHRNQSVGEALGDAVKAGGLNAAGEGALRVGIGAAQNLLGRAARTGARTILSSPGRPASPAVVETALRERLLPMARSGEYLTDKALRETADTASTQLGGQLIPGTKGAAQPYTPAGATTFRVRTHPREVHEASATLRQLLDQSAVEPAITGTIRAARNVNAGQRAPVGAVARNAFGTATKAAADVSPRGVMQRAYATGDLRTAADALRNAAEPGAAATLDRFREILPVRTAYGEAGSAARRIVQDPRALPTSPINFARQAFRLPRLIGPASRAAYRASTTSPGVISGLLRGDYQATNLATDNGLDEIRQAIIDGLIRPMPSH